MKLLKSSKPIKMNLTNFSTGVGFWVPSEAQYIKIFGSRALEALTFKSPQADPDDMLGLETTTFTQTESHEYTVENFL